MAREPEQSKTPRVVALAAMIGTAVVLAVTALVLAQGDIPSYPKAQRICSGHVSGSPTPGGAAGPHVEWTAYASLDAPETVVAWYEHRLARGLHRREGRQDIWRVPFDRPRAVLTVSTPVDAAPLTGCTERPAAPARTVIVMSTMARP
jgi:hypothetical protein